MSKQPYENEIDKLYSDKNVTLKRTILMDMIGAILDSPRKESSTELWKLYIDAALDQLDESIYKPFIKDLLTKACINELEKFILDSKTYGLPNGDFEITMKQRIKELKSLTTLGDEHE
jgi:hypothetical protein